MWIKIIFIFFIQVNFLNSQICQPYQNYCYNCNPLTNLCVKCESDIFTPDENGGCIGAKKCQLGKNYCNKCDIVGELCSECEIGYFPDKNGGCSYTDNCKISSKGECIECDTDFILLGKEFEFKICKYLGTEDFKNCKLINKEKGYCFECEDGFILNGGDRKCTKLENCYESIYGNCISCNQKYYLNKKENKCYLKFGNLLHCKISLDGENCDVCDDYSYFDEIGNCVEINHCSESIDGKCQKCISNYYLTSNNKSCSIDKNCNFAEQETGICNLCNPEYYLDLKDYKCKSNRENNDYKYCQKVVDNKCTQCIQGYKLSKDSKCTSTYRCIEAENGECMLCEDNYYLGLDHKCSNVKHCIYTNYYEQCIECEDGYYYLTLNRTCLRAKNNLENCKVSGGSICSECKNNFYLNKNDSTCVNNTKKGPIYKCEVSDKNNEFCEKCREGYYLGTEDKKCTLVKNCKISKNEKTCAECDEYYCLDVKKGICVENDYVRDENIKFYFACNKTNEDGTACEQCLEGYKIGEDGYCVDVSRCLEKKDGKCIKCTEEFNENGYSYCANGIFGCVETVDDYCLRCENLLELYSCTECKEGYELGFGTCYNPDEFEEEHQF